jgi:adenylate cyclase
LEATTPSGPDHGTGLDRRRLTAIVYADLAGYSRLIGEDDAGTFARIAELRTDLIDPAIARNRGCLVGTAGDSLLVLFDSILDAIRFAIEVQRAIPSYDGDYAPERLLRYRMGVNVGDVIPDGSNMHGDGVNVAARLQGVCPVGAICVSRIVRDQVGNRLGLPFKELGALTLKNIDRPIEAFVVEPGSGVVSPPIAPRRRWRLAIAGAAIVVIAAGLAFGLRPRAPTVAPAPTLASVNEAEPPPLSIAVLPFDNMSGDPEQAYIADGIADDLTTDLAHLVGAFVISRESAFSFRGKAIDIREIGRQLGVRYVLEGSVRRVSNNVRINAQLIAAETGAHVWAERFDKPVASLGEGQDDIVANIASALDVRLVNLDAARGVRAQSGSPAAFDLVLRARAVLNEPYFEEQRYLALGLFLQALRADPNSVSAMAGTAAMYAWLFSTQTSFSFDAQAMIARASHLVAAAEARQPDMPEVMAAKFLVLEVSLRYGEAVSLYNHILDTAPNATSLILQVGFCSCWASAADELEPLRRTIRLNPRSAQVERLKWQYARDLLIVGRTAEAIAELEPLVASRGPGEPSRWQSYARLLLAIGYVRGAQFDDAKKTVAMAMKAENLREFTVWRWDQDIPRYSSPENVLALKHMGDDLLIAGVPMKLDERADSGVPSGGELQDVSGLASPTPMTVPGGQTVTTPEVEELLAKQNPLILSAAGVSPTIPGAYMVAIPGGGTVHDDWQVRLGRLMNELSKGDLDRPILVFSYSIYRWPARNLALRLIALGYRNVLWYRGGLQAWRESGHRVKPFVEQFHL